MAKLTLTDITSGFLSPTTFNANNTAIEAALENTLSRDGTSPNTMSANLDMNSNKITNLTDGTNNQDAVTVAMLNAATITAGATISGLSDVTITSVASGEILKWNGTAWINNTLAEAGIDLSLYAPLAGATFTGDVTLNDSVALDLGTGSDAQLEWTGSRLQLSFPNGAGNIWDIHDGTSLRLYDSTDTDFLQINCTATDIVFSASGIDDFFFQDAAVAYNFQDAPNGVRIWDSGNTDYIDINHDGTDGNIGGSNITDLNITSDITTVTSEANLYLRSASGFRVYEASNADYMNIVHNGSNAVFTTFQTAAYRFEDSDIYLMDGQTFRVYDSGNDDFLQISCAAGQATIEVAGTGSPAGLTINENTDLNGQTLQQFVAGNFDYQDNTQTVSANAVTLTYSNGPAFDVDLEAATGTVTITISGGPSASNYGIISVRVQQDSTADRTITWAGGTFAWAGGSAHTQQTGSDAVSIYTFETWDGGTTWYATGADYS